MMQHSSVETQASSTAAATAFLRALAASDPSADRRERDHLADIFLDEKQSRPLKDRALRAWVLQSQLAPGAYEFMLARTAFFDQIVARALQDNLAQIVLLGAGYDSRPYRFSKWIQDTRIFEVDAPLTQQRKMECLQRAAVTISPQICFVHVNFEIDSLSEVLGAADFQREGQTLFIWEGVSYYLSREAVDQTLAAITTLSRAGSLIAFDYAAISATTLSDDGVQEFRKLMRTRHADEPARFGIPAGQIETFLNERGFQVLEHLTAAEMNEKYLTSDSDTATGRVPPLFCLVLAEVR